MITAQVAPGAALALRRQRECGWAGLRRAGDDGGRAESVQGSARGLAAACSARLSLFGSRKPRSLTIEAAHHPGHSHTHLGETPLVADAQPNHPGVSSSLVAVHSACADSLNHPAVQQRPMLHQGTAAPHCGVITGPGGAREWLGHWGRWPEAGCRPC